MKWNMVKVMYNDKLVCKVCIWLLFEIIFGKEKIALRQKLWDLCETLIV